MDITTKKCRQFIALDEAGGDCRALFVKGAQTKGRHVVPFEIVRCIADRGKAPKNVAGSIIHLVVNGELFAEIEV